MESSRKEQIFVVTTVAVLMIGGVAFGVAQFLWMDAPENLKVTFAPPTQPAFASGPARSPTASSASITPMAPAAREKFLAVYKLEEKEFVKHIPPPIIPERDMYIRSNMSLSASQTIGSAVFRYTNGQPQMYSTGGTGGLPISSLLSMLMALRPNQIDAPAALLSTSIAGDWIFRPEATIAQKAEGFAAATGKALKKNIKLEMQSLDRDVVVMSGTFALKPLEGSSNPSAVHIFIDQQDAATPTRTTNFVSLPSLLTAYTGVTFVNESPAAPMASSVQCVIHNSFMQARTTAPMSNEQIDKLIALIAQQTGLEVKKVARKTDVWKITEG